MKKTSNNLAIGVILTAILVACGGGGGGGLGTSSLSGTVATGAAVTKGAVTVYDATGAQVATGSISDDGSYVVSVPSTAKAPLFLKAEFDGQTLYSVKTNASSGVTNISQLSTAVTAMSVPGVDLDALTDTLVAGLTVNAATVDSAVLKIQSAISPAVSAIQASGGVVGNFMTDTFSADGTGIDKLLDMSKVGLTTLSDGGQNLANVELTFNSAIGLDDPNASEPKGFTFNSNLGLTDISAAASSVSISKEDIPHKELAAEYQNFLKRMQSCYSLPVASRGTKSAVVDGKWTFTVQAQECKDMFFNSDPALYKDGGFGVGYARFSGLSAENVKISAAKSPIMLQNIKPNSSGELDGRALIAVRGEDAEGNHLNATIVVKMFSLNGKRVMGAFGDQNATEFYVNSGIDVVNHPLTDGANDYVSSAYQIHLPATYPNKTVSYAEIKTPKGDTFYLGKNGNKSSLYFCTNQTNKSGCTKPANLIQALRYISQSRHEAGEGPFQLANLRKNFLVSSSQTSTTCPQFLYTNSTDWGVNKCPRTDSEIEDQKAGGLWIATYHFTDNTTSDPLYARHPSRALSNRELMSSSGPDSKAAKLTVATIDRFKKYTDDASTSGRGYAANTWKSDATLQSPIWSPASGGYLFEWDVQSGQIPPRQIYMSGSVGYVKVNSASNAIDEGGGASKTIKSVYSSETSSGKKYFYPAEADKRPNWDEKLRFVISKRSQEMVCTPITVNDDISCAGSSGGTWRKFKEGDLDANAASLNADRQFTLKASDGSTISTSTGVYALFNTSNGDQATSTPIISGTSNDFAPGSWMSYANLWTKDENQRNLTRAYNFYNPY